MTDGYRFELMDVSAPPELAAASALLRRVFAGAKHLTARHLAWQYRDNPDGAAVACNAYFGEELVGHMAALPMLGRFDGEVRPGLFMANGAVDADHRRRGLQSRISAAIFEEAVRRGYDFCFGTGNRYSTIPLLTRFKLIGPLDARIGLGMPARSWSTEPASFERQWSEQALRWRLADPERPAAVRARAGDVAMLAATGVPGVAAILMAGRNEWRMESAGAAPGPFRLWLGLDRAIDWAASTFVSVPTRLRPSPLNLVFKDLAGAGLAPDPARLVFRAIDFDPY